MNIFSPIHRPDAAREATAAIDGNEDSGAPPAAPEAAEEDDEVTPMAPADEEELARMTSGIALGNNSPSRAYGIGSPDGLSLMVPNPFAAPVSPSDASMPTASPRTPPTPQTRGRASRVTAAPALPQPPRFAGRTMEDRRAFMRAYETYLTAINALQTLWGGAFAMPVGACIEGRTKRMIARYEFGVAPERVTEDQWIAYFLQARVPTHVDYATVDVAMRGLRMKTDWPEAESRIMNLQADLEAILDRFNIVDAAFQHEQKRLVKYLGDALAPDNFKRVVATRLSLQENKQYRTNVVAYCAWVTSMLREFITWERAALPPATSPSPSAPRNDSLSSGGRRGRRSGPRPAAQTTTAGGNGFNSPSLPGPSSVTAAPAVSTTRAPSGSGSSMGASSRSRIGPCLKCQSTSHHVRDCPLTGPGEADVLLQNYYKSRDARRATEATSTPTRTTRLRAHRAEDEERDFGTTAATVDGLPVQALLLDSGADASLVAQGVLDSLAQLGKQVATVEIVPRTLSPVGTGEIRVRRSATFKEVVLSTSAGPLMLRSLVCYVEEENLSLDLTVGRPVMRILGYSTDALLVQARGQQPAWELGKAEDQSVATADTSATPLQKIQRLQQAALGSAAPAAPLSNDHFDERTTLPSLAPDSLEDVIKTLEASQALAREEGMSAAGQVTLKGILRLRADVFRLQFGHDPPVKVAPMHVRVKPDAVPVRAKPRRYSPLDRDFLDRHTRKLLEHDLVYVNHRSRWASAPRIVRKNEQDTDPTSDPRMTIDTRRVNDCTEPMSWPMPVLEVVVGELEGATVFFVLDWFRGYWQLPLHEDSQELYTFVTHRAMYTPTRVPMGAADSVAYCQGVVEEIFGDLLGHGVLAWLDDILGYAATEEELLKLLDQVLERCAWYGLKLHAKKCRFYQREVKWCGKVFSAAGVRHCPERVQGLVDMPIPTTADQLQQFLCAVNWMRQSIPEYTKITARLYATLEHAMTLAGSRKKAHLRKVLLSDAGWSAEDNSGLSAIRDALLKMVPLAHPRPEAAVCLYCDSSQDFWGAVATQLDAHELHLPLEQQNHKPLAFLSGRFVGSAARWPIVEKEAFAIVEATRRLEYLLLRPGGFHLYTDHRNLVYIFNPYATDSTMARYQADKLQRWALSLMSFRYVIEHVPGEANVWGDLLSRWGAGTSLADRSAVRISRLAIVHRVSPLEDVDFAWPSDMHIRAAQDSVPTPDIPSGVRLNASRGLFLCEDGRVWVPPAAHDLQQRLCVVAHAGASGHRGATATRQALAAIFHWETLSADVSSFTRQCLHCMITAAGLIPRPFGETLRATHPNEVVHFDFLTMVEGTGGSKYVLVLKDDMSGFVELVACAHATSDQVYESLLDWFKRYGVALQWVSDQGAHFKNQVIERLQRSLGAQHHFTTAYCPWANGTVEVVNREVLRAVKALLSEKKLLVGDWPQILPVVQAALNGMPADRLGGVSPLTAFTALPGSSQLRSILHPRTTVDATVEWVEQDIRDHLAEVRRSLDGMHRELVDAAEKRRKAARDRHAQKKGVILQKFSVGDFVLAATATGTAGNKLALLWKGPKRIVTALNDYTFEVQDLMEPFTVTVRHASRLQLYREAHLGLSEDIVEQVIHGEGGHLVERLLACRLSPATHRWEIQVKWYGLDEVEASWEPADNIKADVPILFEAFVATGGASSPQQRMAVALAPSPPLASRPARLPRSSAPRTRASRSR